MLPHNNTSISLGEISISKTIQHRMVENNTFHHFVYSSLMSHETGDWGNISPDQWAENQLALITLGIIQSEFNFKIENDIKFSKLLIHTNLTESATLIS